MEKAKILIVDDDAQIRMLLSDLLTAEGYRIVEAGDGKKAIEVTEKENPSLVILDLLMPKMSGLEVLNYFREHRQDIMVIVLTAYGTVESAVEAMKLGAHDYLIKSDEPDKILMVIKRTLKHKELSDINQFLVNELDKNYQMVVGSDPAMDEIMKTVNKIAREDITVLIQGESGTGKQLLAWAIHKMSPRKDKPFIQVNCTTLSETLIESDLFGHEKGAFTGASKQKKGRFEIADKGTIFLDEIGELAPNIQAKLLQVIEYHKFQRVGGLEDLFSNVRIIAATNKNLENEVKAGTFRKDLLFRLKVFTVTLPPLRERIDDIPIFADFFLNKQCTKMQKHVTEITPEAMELLQHYSWPGNIRELENIIERAIVLTNSSKITPDLLSPIIHDDTEHTISATGLVEATAEFKRAHIKKALKKTDNNQTKAAELLNVQRTYLNRIIKELGISI